MDTRIVALALAAALSPALADDAHHPEAAGQAKRITRAEDQTLTQMQEHMKRMQQTMARIQETTHPDERQELVDQHSREMQYGMKLMLEHEKAMHERSR
jgi:exonuclease VII large subunit